MKGRIAITNLGGTLKYILSCLILLSAASVHVYAMNFDAEEAYGSIFVVYSGKSQGSGFAIGSNTVITNAHVIADKNNVLFYNYEGNTYKASVYLIDRNFDIAVLSVENADFVPLPIGDCEDIKVGDDIYAIGAPKSMGYTLTKGVISSRKRKVGDYTYLQIDAAINSGNSGGPLLNSNGQVIGVNSMKVSDADGIGLAIPMAAVIEFMENNGIVVKEDSTVEGEIPFNGLTGDSNNAEVPERDATDSFSSKRAVIVLSVCLFGSVIVNAILIVILMYQKTKNKYYVPDKSERTDFDIDLLE